LPRRQAATNGPALSDRRSVQTQELVRYGHGRFPRVGISRQVHGDDGGVTSSAKPSLSTAKERPCLSAGYKAQSNRMDFRHH
jgi:hypothetical protein